MEVHHHPHTSSKKWTHYLWEFLMLFLAVFCGFLAEYQLEHKLEKDREKQFIRSMIEDLKSDTASLNRAIMGSQKQVFGKDSFILLLDGGKWSRDEVKQLYDFHWNYLGHTSGVYFSKRTLMQLFNAGGLRLIRNRLASDSITMYATQVEHIENKVTPMNIEYS